MLQNEENLPQLAAEFSKLTHSSGGSKGEKRHANVAPLQPYKWVHTSYALTNPQLKILCLEKL